MHSGSGFAKYPFAYKSLIANLHLNQPKAAQDWCAGLAETDTYFLDSRAYYQEAQAQLALYQQQPQQAVQHATTLAELCVAFR